MHIIWFLYDLDNIIHIKWPFLMSAASFSLCVSLRVMLGAFSPLTKLVNGPIIDNNVFFLTYIFKIFIIDTNVYTLSQHVML